MGRVGYLSIRNIPKISSNEDLITFFKTHKVCPKCRGLGHKQINRRISPTSIIRLDNIKELEAFKSLDISMTDVIRDILEYQCLNKRSCSLCHGFRFIKKASKEKERGQKKRISKKKSTRTR